MAEQHQTPRGSYTTYTPEQKAMIGRYAAENGNSKAVHKYTAELGISVKESTVRQFKKAYYLQLNEGKDPDDIKMIPNKKRGRPSKGGFQVKGEEVTTTEFPDEVDISSCIAVRKNERQEGMYFCFCCCLLHAMGCVIYLTSLN